MFSTWIFSISAGIPAVPFIMALIITTVYVLIKRKSFSKTDSPPSNIHEKFDLNRYTTLIDEANTQKYYLTQAQQSYLIKYEYVFIWSDTSVDERLPNSSALNQDIRWGRYNKVNMFNMLFHLRQPFYDLLDTAADLNNRITSKVGYTVAKLTMEYYSHHFGLKVAKTIAPNTFSTNTTKKLIKYMRLKPMMKHDFKAQIDWALKFTPHKPNDPQFYKALNDLVDGYNLTVD